MTNLEIREMNDVNNMADVIDSRDIIERINDLQILRGSWASDNPFKSNDEYKKEYPEEHAEQVILEELAEVCADYASDWEYGETLVRDSYFEEYAQELAEDTGMINSDATWPNNCIDWERAANELKYDYTSVDFDGVDYWIRSY